MKPLRPQAEEHCESTDPTPCLAKPKQIHIQGFHLYHMKQLLPQEAYPTYHKTLLVPNLVVQKRDNWLINPKTMEISWDLDSNKNIKITVEWWPVSSPKKLPVRFSLSKPLKNNQKPWNSINKNNRKTMKNDKDASGNDHYPWFKVLNILDLKKRPRRIHYADAPQGAMVFHLRQWRCQACWFSSEQQMHP